jgi:Pyruvate/2-oxoacid:ferredoxin oxidoreductase delta subunit
MKNTSELPSLSIAEAHFHRQDLGLRGKIGLALGAVGLGVLLLRWSGLGIGNKGLDLSLLLGGIGIGTILFSWDLYRRNSGEINNNGVWFNSLTSRGAWAWISGIVFTGFYVQLYWFPDYLGLSTVGAENEGLVGLFDPLSMAIKGRPASQWFVYGTLYTLLILALGLKFILKYRHLRYHRIRTLVLMGSQFFLAWLIPEILEGISDPNAYFAKDLKYFWPLNYFFFETWHLNNLHHGGTMGMVFLIWGIVLFLLVTPFLTYFFGKRWYCSWVCGCGGLAETAGDPWRHLSSKRISAWRLERWMIHAILVYISVVTCVVLYGYFSGEQEVLGLSIYHYFSKPYGFLIGAAFSGVIGVGFYPLLGSRIWCRFGCPLAGYMGLFQRFKSRFRITTNGGQCISCGNCSTYCEQGIDVRWYAQRGQNIVRASCVGCGICSSVCPRGVLKLENASENGRINDNPILIGGGKACVKT